MACLLPNLLIGRAPSGVGPPRMVQPRREREPLEQVEVFQRDPLGIVEALRVEELPDQLVGLGCGDVVASGRGMGIESLHASDRELAVENGRELLRSARRKELGLVGGGTHNPAGLASAASARNRALLPRWRLAERGVWPDVRKLLNRLVGVHNASLG